VTNLNFAFWANRDQWPTAEDHVFLAEAVHRIGKALFPDTWTGFEPLVDDAPPRPPRPPPQPLQMVGDRTSRTRVTQEPQSLPPSVAPRSEISPELDHALKAVATAREKLEAGRARYAFDAAAVSRYWAVRTQIIAEAENERLVFATQSVAGGPLEKLPAFGWADWSERFARCQLRTSRGERYLFVTSESLGSVLAAIRGERSSTVKTGRPIGSTTFDWPAFNKKALQELVFIGGVDLAVDPVEKPARIAEAMKRWCGKKVGEAGWPKVPSDRMIREHVKRAVEDYRAGKK